MQYTWTSPQQLDVSSGLPDGTAATAGDTCGLIGEASREFVNAVNALNGGRGFPVLAGRSEPLYFRLNLTEQHFENGAYNASGAASAEALFPEMAFVMVRQGRMGNRGVVRRTS